MTEQDYHVRIAVDATENEVFRAISDVTKWWTENLEGSSQQEGDEFTVRFADVHFSRQKLTGIIPGKKIVWLVTESKLGFIKRTNEWTNTSIRFEISPKEGKTQIDFTHIGLVPAIECYNACSNAWGGYIQGSLFKLLTEGKGTPELRV